MLSPPVLCQVYVGIAPSVIDREQVMDTGDEFPRKQSN
jgi:hypothetical protein